MNVAPETLYLRWLLIANVAVLLLYGGDKLCAIRQWRRVPERVLLGMVLAGGFLGGWLGQIGFRHKIRKPRFWLVLIVATLLHGALIWSRWRGAGFSLGG